MIRQFEIDVGAVYRVHNAVRKTKGEMPAEVGVRVLVNSSAMTRREVRASINAIERALASDPWPFEYELQHAGMPNDEYELGEVLNALAEIMTFCRKRNAAEAYVQCAALKARLSCLAVEKVTVDVAPGAKQ